MIDPDEKTVIAEALVEVAQGCLPCAAAAACKLDQAMPWESWLHAVAEASVTTADNWTVDDLDKHRPCRQTSAH